MRPNTLYMVIPNFIPTRGSWPALPPGIHRANLRDVNSRLCFNEHRQQLFNGLVRASTMLRSAGCKLIHLAGSFVTAKEYPQDYDACWNCEGVDPNKLDTTFLDSDYAKQKCLYLGEFYLDLDTTPQGESFVEYFQKGKYTEERGIIAINLQDPTNNLYCL